MGIKIKKISPKQFGKALEKGAKGIGKQVVNAGKGVAAAGKALGKCKPGDAKCIAKGMGDLAMSGAKLALAASPAGVAYGGANAASGGALNKVTSQIGKSVLGVDPQEFGRGGIQGFAKAYGKALYHVSGAETVVTAGKALAKCKPKDAACIAKNLGQIASVAANFIPGAGGAAAVAMKVAKAAVKAAVQKAVEAKIKAEMAKKKKNDAQAKLNAATTDQERRDALVQLNQASNESQQAEMAISQASTEQAVAEKQVGDAAIVVSQQVVSEQAQKIQQEQMKANPEIAAQIDVGLHPDSAKAQSENAAATSQAGTEALLSQQNAIAEGLEQLSNPKIFGIPQMYFIGLVVLILIAIGFFMIKRSPTQ